MHINKILILSLCAFLLLNACGETEVQNLDSLPTDAEDASAFKTAYPVESIFISQGFMAGHYAIDFAREDESIANPDILAVYGGTVIDVKTGDWNGGYGNSIMIDHGNGFKSLYAHCNETFVNVGDSVTAGQVIANMGNTGRVYGKTGIQLHFELWKNNGKVNPMDYFVEE
ncbi:MAG: M23 family metallopeptidase [Candidatus Gracilibacteria bacterium]